MIDHMTSHKKTYLSLFLEILDEFALGKSVRAKVPHNIGEGPATPTHQGAVLIDECVGGVPHSLQAIPLGHVVVKQLDVMKHHLGAILKKHLGISILERMKQRGRIRSREKGSAVDISDSTLKVNNS